MGKSNVLVTGGAGYIGSHACKALSQAGFTPITVDSLISGHEWAVKWGPLEIADITNEVQLGKIIRKYRPIGAMHFAAFACVGESVTEPEKYYYNNVWGSLNLLKILRKADINKIVFSSSCATYGIPDSVPITEDHPQAPINCYGRSKLMTENILEDFNAAYGMEYIALRYFNAAGADPEGEIGEDHDPETHALPLAIQAALGKRKTFEIYGADYPTSDGTAVRDYIQVCDLAKGHVIAMQYLLEGGKSLKLNMGTGLGHSVLEIIASVERVSGKSIPLKFGPKRKGDPPVLVANPSRAEKILGWKARYLELDEIVKTAVRWHVR